MTGASGAEDAAAEAVAADAVGGSAGYTVLRGLLSDTALHTFRQEESKLRHLLAPDPSTLEELGYWGTLSLRLLMPGYWGTLSWVLLMAGCGYWGTLSWVLLMPGCGYWGTLSRRLLMPAALCRDCS